MRWESSYRFFPGCHCVCLVLRIPIDASQIKPSQIVVFIQLQGMLVGIDTSFNIASSFPCDGNLEPTHCVRLMFFRLR